MATYVLLTKLSPASMGAPARRQAVGRKWLADVKKKCPSVKWIEHYALLGPFDFLDVFEAPNEEEAAKVSMITMARGAVKAETWTAIPYKRFLNVAAQL
jgi:uncharacterized protein with GYD domain